MTGKELTDRLISDIEAAIELKKSVGTINEELTGEDKNLGTALKLAVFDQKLELVATIINTPEITIEGQSSLSEYVDKLKENKESVSARVQTLLDSKTTLSGSVK